MSTFAPVYRAPQNQESHLKRAQRRKRRKLSHTSAESDDSGSSSDSAVEQPVSRVDPYHVAGWSRKQDPPTGSFPHAPVRTVRPKENALDEELLALNPPVHRITRGNDDHNIITIKRHIDNLTTLLHRCVNNGDWQRASRILGLLLRSEYNGVIDLRQHNRWALAAEVLMRRDGTVKRDDADDSGIGSPQTAAVSDTGLQAARKYYERMVLQYPHTARSANDFNASVLYPSLFNIWIFEVQQRSQLARAQLEPWQMSPPAVSEASEHPDDKHQSIREDELVGAKQIADRLGQLTVSPPYDANVELLRLQSMVTSWLADLYQILARSEQGMDYQDKSQQLRMQSRDVRQRIAEIQD